MPDGQISWMDPSVGEAGISQAGHTYVARLHDIEPGARHVGARVRFAIRKSDGASRAVEVTLRPGMRAAPHHGRVGTLVGAHDASRKAADPFVRRHPEYGHGLTQHPLQVVSAWGQAVAGGDVDDALALYAPDPLMHFDGVAFASRRHIRERLESLPVFASGRFPTVQGLDGTVVARWEAPTVQGRTFDVVCQVRHGLITEQWIGEHGLQMTRSTLHGVTRPWPVTATTDGHLPTDAVEYAIRRLGQVAEHASEPILSVSIKLSMASDPARTRPAMAQISVDLNGSFLGAHTAAHEIHEAIDLLAQRLAGQLRRRAERLEALRRRGTGPPEPGEWRHADPPTVRPEYFDRPTEERQLVRHKAFISAEETVEEAIFDMEQLDYDFYLFRDLLSGQDSMVERLSDGSFRLQHVRPTDQKGAYGPYRVERADRPAPSLTIGDAIDHLTASGRRWEFFADSSTGQGCVMYLRYDGHYGLITLK